jgi:hypothetical protein
MNDPKRVDFARAYLKRQKILSAQLEIPIEFTKHPTALGDSAEANWQRMIQSFLPARYQVGPAFAIDAHGNSSKQLDIVVYDRQYSPLWFESAGDRYVPVESVYAVFEVKQKITKAFLGQAAAGVASVRNLQRTSGKIVDIHGTHSGPSPTDRPILGGILALTSEWVDGLAGETGKRNITSHASDEHLDMGLALVDAAFDNVPKSANLALLDEGLRYSQPGTQLIFFMMSLFRRLQSIGSALAVDLAVYQEALEELDVSDYTEGELDN